MARPNLADVLQSHTFFLMDVAPIEPLSLPIFTPLFGFSSITTPEINIETQTIAEGNWFFDKKVAKRGSVSNITLTRGVTFYDSDFWRWIQATLAGDTDGFQMRSLPFIKIGGPTVRRNLILIHFFARTPVGALAAAVGGAITAASGALGGPAAAIAAASTLGSALSVGPFEFALKVPAKAYLLKGCIPVRYKPGSDFDARSGDVSIAELEVAIDEFEEISLSA